MQLYSVSEKALKSPPSSPLPDAKSLLVISSPREASAQVPAPLTDDEPI